MHSKHAQSVNAKITELGDITSSNLDSYCSRFIFTISLLYNLAIRTINQIRLKFSKRFTPQWLLENFDEQIYLRQNQDVYDAIQHKRLGSGFEHWIIRGQKEYIHGKRKPGFFEYDTIFREDLYLEANPDVAYAVTIGQFISGYQHWALHGEAEFKSGIRRTGFIEEQQYKEWIPERDILYKGKTLRTAQESLKQFLQQQTDLLFPQSEKPTISIIIVLHNQAALSLRCFQALQKNYDVPIEIIIIDNNSTDETELLLKKTKGATVFINKTNNFYIKAFNQAISHCKGEFILLLNNDAAIEPCSLSIALKTLCSASDIGAVGGKVILPDGTLQEAGSIIWQDGTCHGYGRHGNPDNPQYNFQRTVDFCSGVFLLVKKELLEQIGGLNEDLSPMYYEDVDLCLRLKALGYRTVYNPNIIINHFEFGSSNSSLWRQNLLFTNQEKILSLHNDFLLKKFPFTKENIIHARCDYKDKPRILFIEDAVPMMKFGAGHPRSQIIINLLADMGASITVCSMARTHSGVFSEPLEWSEIFNEINPEVEVFKDFQYTHLEDFMNERKTFYEYIFVFRPHNMSYISELFDKSPSLFNKMKIIYDAEALYANRRVLEKKIQNTPLPQEEVSRTLHRELSHAAIADTIITVSNQEAVFFQQRNTDIKVIGYPIETKVTDKTFHDRAHMLFIGAFHNDDAPNVDAVYWFVKEVLPLINKDRDAPIKLSIAGTCNSTKIKTLQSSTVEVLGYIDDITTLCNQYRFLISPIRFAAGIPLKAIQAASVGLPVIGTTLISKLLEWENEKHMLAADTPSEFANACLRLYRDENLWTNLQSNGYRAVKNSYSKSSAKEVLKEIFFTNEK